MSDVTCACCAPIIAEVRTRGLPPEPLVDGLGLDLATLESPRNRIPWDEFTVFYRRASALLGVDALEELALRSAEDSVPRVIRRLLPKLGDARAIYRMGARWWGPWVFRGTRATCEELGDGRLREVIEILPGYDECPEFFQGIRGVLRAMPTLFGQPEAVVELVKRDSRRGEFLITLPPAKRRTRLGLRRKVQALPEELEELGFGQEQLRESQRRTRAASALLAGRSRQLGALTRIGRELGRSQPGQKQVETVVRLLQEHFRVRGVRLSREQEGGAVAPIARAGELIGAPSEVHAVRVGGRSVGRLELWGFDSAESTWDDAELLRELLPWVGLALERALHQEASRPLVEELNDVLTVILGYASLVGDELSEDSPARGEIGEIRTASERAAALLSRVLAHLADGQERPEEPWGTGRQAG